MRVGEDSSTRGNWRGRWGQDEEGLSRTSLWDDTTLLGLVLERSLILAAE